VESTKPSATGSAEFGVAVACCRWNFSGTHETIAVPATIDWQRFLALAHFHRIEGLAFKALGKSSLLPDHALEALSEAASRIAAENLRASVACGSLLDRFEAAGIPLLFLKGLTLGLLAYGDRAVKAAIDIDLLIDPENLDGAASLLRQEGYRLSAPRESPEDRILRRWHRSWKESVWMRDSCQLQVDLHTRPADNRRLIPAIDVHAPSQAVDVGDGISLPTLAEDHLFAYLAVHGASTAWFRLKWISDLAALLHGRETAEIERLYFRSQELGASRAAGQALLLADHLFGTLEEDLGFRDRLARDRVTQRLLGSASHLMTAEPVEPTEKFLGTLPIHQAQLLLMPGIRYQASEIARQASRLIVKARS